MEDVETMPNRARRVRRGARHPAPARPAPVPTPTGGGGTLPSILAGIPQDVFGRAAQRTLDGMIKGEFPSATIAAIVGMGLDPLRASTLYWYVRTHSYTPSPAQDVAGAVGGVVGGWVGDLFKVLSPILKITAGGAGLIVSGIALVYVAGRNTGAGRAAGQVVGNVGKVTGPAGRAASRAVSRSAGGVRRAELGEAKERARARIREKERAEARGAAEERIRIERPAGKIRTVGGHVPRERVRVVSAREGRAASSAQSLARARRQRSRLIELRSRQKVSR